MNDAMGDDNDDNNDDNDDDLDDGKIRFAFIRREKFLQRFATSFRAQLLILSR